MNRNNIKNKHQLINQMFRFGFECAPPYNRINKVAIKELKMKWKSARATDEPNEQQNDEEEEKKRKKHSHYVICIVSEIQWNGKKRLSLAEGNISEMGSIECGIFTSESTTYTQSCMLWRKGRTKANEESKKKQLVFRMSCNKLGTIKFI